MFTLTFTQEQMQVISQALAEMPFRMVAPLINDINAQITKQQVKPTEEVSS